MISRKWQTLVILIFCVLAPVTFQSCTASEIIAILVSIFSAKITADGQATITAWIGGQDMVPVNESATQVTYSGSFKNENTQPADEYPVTVQIKKNPGATLKQTAAAILLLPADARDFSLKYNDYQGSTGSLKIEGGITRLEVTPGQFITAASGEQLVVLESTLSSKNEHWYNLELKFKINPVRPVEMKGMVALKIETDGKTYHLPLCPATADFSLVPAVTIPVSQTFQTVGLPLANTLPVPPSILEYDLTSPEQTRYLFPRLDFLAGNSTEGYGFVNTGEGEATVTCRAFNSEGQQVGPASTRSFAGGAQGAFDATALFELGNGPVEAWVQVESDSPGLRGFFLSQSFNSNQLTGMDGGGVFTAGFTRGILPRVRSTGGFITDLFIANPGDESVTVTLTANGDGVMYAGGTHSILPKGLLVLDLGSSFHAKASFDGWVLIEASGPVIANASVHHLDGSHNSLNAIPAETAANRLCAPHITLFPGIYFSELNIVNPGNSPVQLTITPYQAGGAALVAPFNVPLPANRQVTLRDTELGLPADVNSDGWIMVESTGGPVTGCLTFGHPGVSTFETTMPLQAGGFQDLYFAHVANGLIGDVNFFTGLAVVNPGAGPVDIVISIHAAGGTVQATINRQLAGHEKYVRLLNLLEGVTPLSLAGGYIHVTATGPVHAFQVFGDESLSFLSAVPAQ